MSLFGLNALLGRMKYITRWSLMHSSREESLSEHTADTAILAHTLGLIAQEITGTPVRCQVLATAALYHDAPEILTGDLPTPVKYFNNSIHGEYEKLEKSPRLKAAYQALEEESIQNMAAMAPPQLTESLLPYLDGSILTEQERVLLKAADRLSALIKCLEECQSGNREFEAARKQQFQALLDMHCPEVEYFMEHMLPCYTLNLDELTRTTG